MNSKNINGFTLIEVMIAVVVVAIMAAIAYPSYTKFVIDSRMQAGMRVMENVAIAQERYYVVKRAYADSLPSLGIIEVSTNVQNDFEPISILTNNISLTTASPSLDPTLTNEKADWVAVLTPRATSQIKGQLRIAINRAGEKWFEENTSCNSSWANRCCAYGDINTATNLCPTPSQARTTGCRDIDWREYLNHKDNRKTLGC